MPAPAAPVSANNRRRRWRLRHFTILFGLMIAVLLALAAVDFAHRLGSTAEPPAALTTAVVFTGQFDRVYAGLALLEAGRIDRLLISGVTPGSGIEVAGFTRQFGLSAALIAALDSGRLRLGTDARNTRENAIETACWVHREKVAGPLLLITSQSHMPRASRALERALPARVIEWLIVADAPSHSASSTLALEFAKYLADAIAALSPGNGLFLLPHSACA